MQKPKGALYLSCDRVHAAACWVAIAANSACVLACAGWAWAHPEARPAAPLWVVAAFVGILVADFFTGMVHWMTDTWLDELMFDRVGSIAREHHLYPHHIVDYGVRDHLAYMSVPTALLLGPVCVLLTVVLPPCVPVYLAVLVTGQVCVFAFFGTHFHKLGHKRTRNRVVRAFERIGFFITPAYHALHHRANHDDYYCVVTRWLNPVLDRTRFWRGFERVIQALTGRVPRQNEEEWQTRFEEDPAFVYDPVPSLIALRAQRAAGRAPSTGA